MKKQIDCSQIKGANYTPSYARNDLEEWRDYDRETVERELGLAKRIGFNSIRTFLNYTVYENDREKFLGNLLHLVRTADSLGMKVMPAVFDSCFSEVEPKIDLELNEWIPNPGVMKLGPAFWPKGEEYCRDLIDLLKNENGLLMWDVMNEPLCTAYVGRYSPEVNEAHKQEIYAFLKHFCDFFRENDEVNPITVGHAWVGSTEETQEWEDILSYHDYSATEAGMKKTLSWALELGKKYGKQMFCSEAGCPGRSNPYDAVIQLENENRTGYFLWELMIGRSFWNDRHGVVYTDGTIRDPSIIAAVSGFFRRRENRTPYNANIEGQAGRVVSRIEDWLSSDRDPAVGLDVLNHAANLLESNQLVPECDLPSAYYEDMKKNGADADGIAAKLDEWLPVLKADIERHR